MCIRDSIIVVLFLAVSIVSAHPGKTDGNGGHTCRTNCEKWGLKDGEYHYHTSPIPSSTPTSEPTVTSTRTPEPTVTSTRTPEPTVISTRTPITEPTEEDRFVNYSAAVSYTHL